MIDVIFFVFNITIYLQYTRLLPCWGITRSTEKFVFAYLLAMTQIIGTLLFLGAVGSLRPFEAVALNSIIILAIPLFFRSAPPVRSGRGAWKEILKPLSNKILLIITTALLGWSLISSYFLPPRGIDDITYHLPFIYESIQRGQWTLLPPDLRVHFAYPMNAEVLFSWSVLFLGDTRWVDVAQLPIGIWTAGIIYLFARHFGMRRSRAFFVAGLFFQTPIVFAQMGTNYIDLSSAGFLLSSLYLMVRFFVTMRKIYIRMVFVSIGIMIGMKYHLFFGGLILALVLFLILIRKRWIGDLMWGVLVIVGLGMGWHLRNYWLFGDLLYPARDAATSWGLMDQSVGDMLISIWDKIELIYIRMISNGTVDGGFGRFYGFIILLFWIVYGGSFLFRRSRWRKGEILIFLITLSLFLIIIPVGMKVFPSIGPRMLLVVWPVFLLTFGRIVFILNKKKWIQKLMITICFLGILQDSVVWVKSLMPHHYWWVKSKQSEFESYRFSSWYVRALWQPASALDMMTRSLQRQSTIFLAAPSSIFFSAPFYGRFLQTKIINFDSQFKGDPDFLVYFTVSDEPLKYIGTYQKTLSEAISSEYKEVFWSPEGKIFAHPRIFDRIGANFSGTLPDFKISNR